MNTFIKKVIEKLKSFHYYFLTSFLGFIGLVVAYSYAPSMFIFIPMLLCLGIFAGLFVVGVFHAFENTWKEGSKGLAIFYAIIFFLIMGLITFAIAHSLCS